jgi:glycosyltransferase EpsD
VNIVHGYLFPERLGSSKAKLLLKCEKMMTKKTDSIIVMNEEDLRIAKEHKLCLGDIHVIDGMGAKTRAEVSPTAKIRKYIESEGKYVLSFVGELSDRKNQRFLICALPEIKIAIPNAVLWLIGAGGGREELIDLAEKLGLSDSVYFIGQTEIPCDFIRASDLYVSASVVEGMPFNVLEALGVGARVLCSNIKGHRDIIHDGKEGFVFTAGDKDALAERVYNIYKEDLRPDAKLAARAYREHCFDEVFEESYKQILAALE